MFDYVIIGNGILSLTTAFRLTQARPESKICIIGNEKRTGSATLAAGAMLGVFGEVTTETFSSHEHRLYFNMAHKASELWPGFVEELNSFLTPENKVRISDEGTYVLLNAKGTSKDDTPNYEAILNALNEFEEPYSEISGEEVTGLYPEETARPIKAIYIPNERFIDSNGVLNGLQQVLRKSEHVTFIDDSANKILIGSSGAVRGAQLANGEEYHAENVIVAAGSGSQLLIDSLPCLRGRIPYLLCGSGVSFILNQESLGEKSVKHVIRTPNRAGACGLHLVPRGDDYKYLYVGAGNMMDWKYRNGASLESATWILSSIVKEFSKELGGTRLLSFFHGSRPFTIDGYPIFGQSSSVSGLWFLSGTGRDGFHCSPLLSSYTVNQLLGNTYRADLGDDATEIFNTFVPERPLIQTYSQEESISKAQKQVYCALHETGGSLTTDLHVPFPEWVERDVRTIYNELDTGYALPPLALLPLICRRWDTAMVRDILNAHKASFAQKPIGDTIAS